MSLFTENEPQWDNIGTAPDSTKKSVGWLVGEKPPAEYLNWLFNRNYKCIDELRTVVDALAVSSGAANTIVYGASATGNDSYVITPNPAIIAYGAGMVVEMYVDVENTAGATINVNAKGVKTIKKITNAGKVALVTGDMVATGVYTLVYDGTDFILANPTAIPASIITAAGDLIYGSGAKTPTRLALGSDGQVLGVASGLPLWVTPTVIVEGSYTGNGGANRTLSIGITPKFVIVTTNTSNQCVGIGTTGNYHTLYGTNSTVAGTSQSRDLRPEITSGGFIVNAAAISLNTNTTLYKYFAIA